MTLDTANDLPKQKMYDDIKVVPWDNPEQFKKVYEYLYSNELKKKRWAVDQISVWETRCHPSLPMSIEASLVISRAIIQDILMINDSSLCQQSDIQMMYAMALVRFVNLMIEPHQKILHAPGAHIAKGLGIPAWLVDLRNEATHSFAPALPTLRMAADCAMKYLNESYWEKEVSNLRSRQIREIDDEEIRNNLLRYIKLQFRIITDAGSDTHKQDVTLLNEVIGKLTTAMHKNKQIFIDILVSKGYFIPHDEVLKKIMTENEYSNYQEYSDEICSGHLSTSPSVPRGLEFLWKKMLILMQSMGILPRFMEALLKCEDGRTEIEKKLVVAWILRILRVLTAGNYSEEETTLRKIFTKKFTLVNWKTLFHSAVFNPCLYTPCIFPLIFTNLNLNKHFTQYVIDLMAIYLGQADWKSHRLPRDYSVQTLDTLKHMMNLQNAHKARRIRSSEECLFFNTEETDYKSWPIGMIVNPVDDEEEENDEEIEDYIPIFSFDEKMDYTEKYFLCNENDMDVNCLEVDAPDLSDEEIDLGDDRQSFLYRIK